jgi:hypothetical protein
MLLLTSRNNQDKEIGIYLFDFSSRNDLAGHVSLIVSMTRKLMFLKNAYDPRPQN